MNTEEQIAELIAMESRPRRPVLGAYAPLYGPHGIRRYHPSGWVEPGLREAASAPEKYAQSHPTEESRP